MPSSTTPNSFFTHSIQSPERGSVCSRLENVPSTRYGNPSPSASVKNDVNPNHGSALAPTIASSATTGGPMQGAANTPTTRPDTNTPAAFVAFTAPARSRIEAGSWISYTPNIDSAMAASNSPI